MSKTAPWSTKPGAWAVDAELEEEENKKAAAAAAAAAAADPQIFPSLKEAATTKPKKKPAKFSLSELHTGKYVGPGGAARRDATSAIVSKGLTPDEMLRLPTGPKERSAEEMQYGGGRLGGGFSSYGRAGMPSGRMRDGADSDSSSWGGGGNRRPYGGFSDDSRGPPPRVSDFDQPSRADEVDNWAAGKKSMPFADSGHSNRYASLGGGGGGAGGFSRADETDNWAVGKKPMAPIRSNTFGSGFRDTRRGDTHEGERERPRLNLTPRQEVVNDQVNDQVKFSKPSPFGAARPREQVLAEKGLDWKKLDSELEAKKTTSRPTSSHSSRPSSAQSSRSEAQNLQSIEGVVNPRPKINPFGDAKPREVLLEEKGKDWRKIDAELEHRRIDRPETEAEKVLKEEIEQLKEFERENGVKTSQDTLQNSGGGQMKVHDLLISKERELEQLIRDLDDKVRFSPRFGRPGSGAGRNSSFHERPSSQSGSFEESRNMEFTERPRSRGTADGWPRQGDDRRSFPANRERGFLGNRDLDRSRSRERW